MLCTGYLGEQVEATFGKSYNGLALSYSQEQSALGTGGALRIALPLLKSEPVLVLNGDSFCQADFIYFLNQHITRKATASLLLTEVPDIGRYGSVQLSMDGKIISFEEKGENRDRIHKCRGVSFKLYLFRIDTEKHKCFAGA